jgi:hypothetical protein
MMILQPMEDHAEVCVALRKGETDPALPWTEAAGQREALVQRLHTPIQVCWRCLETTAARLMKAAQKENGEVLKNEATFLSVMF